MPDNMPRLAYINAKGAEIVLDDDEHSFLGELRGRIGFEAPELGLTDVEFGNGSRKVVSVELKPREVTCYFWTETPDLAVFEAKFNKLKGQLIQFGTMPGNGWGRLRIKLRTGGFVYLNCLYSEGLESMTRDVDCRAAFSLTFHADDPLFYDLSSSTLVLRVYSEGDRLVFRSTTFFGADTHFRSSDASHEEKVNVECFRVYPDIVITGPADNIMLVNVTTGKTIRFEHTFSLLAGESLEINTQPTKRMAYWVRQNGTKVKALRYLTADTSLDWFMTSGENVLRYRNTNLNAVSTCTMTFQQGWLSAN